MHACSELCVKVDNSLTDSFPSRIGVRQGDNLSPNLFKLFVNDLPEIFKGDCFPVSINSPSLNCLLYADDVLFIPSLLRVKIFKQMRACPSLLPR